MLTKEKNDLITQTGPGTPMGNVYRSYWIPALLAEELPEPNCPPVRVQLLSEYLIGFRDSERSCQRCIANQARQTTHISIEPIQFC